MKLPRQLAVGAVALAVLSLCAAGCSRPPATESSTVKIEFYVSVPEVPGSDDDVFISGNLPALGAWKANGVQLRRVNAGLYATTLELPRGETLEFKVTRGSWETVEKGPLGEEIRNRTLALDKNRTERLAVASWATGAEAAARQHTITGDVREHTITSTNLNNARKLWVFLPPGYDADPTRRYPVLYMHDGQNIFDDATSFAGEWHADEIATVLIEMEQIEPMIIVGIENNADRVHEYTPTEYLGEGGRAPQYAKFVVEEVKPFIDRTYRTKTGRAATGIAGSSLGGIVSLYLTQQYPDTFSRCAALSPSLWWDQRKFLAALQQDTSWAKGLKLWFDTGTHENGNNIRSAMQVADCKQLAGTLQRRGFVPDKDFVYREYLNAPHNEQAWADRFDEVLLFLYGK